MDTSPALLGTIAGARISTSVFFLLFGEYKVVGPGFAHGGFQAYLQDYIANSAVGFYRPVLAGLVLSHAVFFGYAVGVGELLIGVSLLLGLWVRPASILGILISCEYASGNVVGSGAWRAGLALFRRGA